MDPIPGNSTVVRFELTETAVGARLTLLEKGFEELDDPAGKRSAWTIMADRLRFQMASVWAFTASTNRRFSTLRTVLRAADGTPATGDEGGRTDRG